MQLYSPVSMYEFQRLASGILPLSCSIWIFETRSHIEPGACLLVQMTTQSRNLPDSTQVVTTIPGFDMVTRLLNSGPRA